MTNAAAESLPVPEPDTPALRIADTPEDGETALHELTEAGLSRIQALRDSGGIRELIDPSLRAKFDAWEASGDY